MTYIPTNSRWYIAEIVQEIHVAGDPRNVIHRNTVLVRADSREEAYERALLLGKQGELSYENPGGHQVQIKFRGLAELSVLHDELEHGAELVYQERIGVPNEEIEGWLLPKEDLSVFRETHGERGPDYSSKEIMG